MRSGENGLRAGESGSALARGAAPDGAGADTVVTVAS